MPKPNAPDAQKATVLKALRETNARLDRLFRENPAAAIKEAQRLLSASEPDDWNHMMIAAGVLVDAGHVLEDRLAVEVGTSLFRRLHEACPASPDLDYNLANGLNALADFGHEPAWSPSLCARRREARGLYQRAASAQDGMFRSKSLTNTANLLKLSYRRLESYDAYVAERALQATRAKVEI